MSAPFVTVADLHRHEEREVTVRGWLTHKRSSGKVAFLMLRDGTGLVQAVLVRSDVPDEVWSAFDGWHTESSLAVRGTVRVDARAPGGYELGVRSVTLIGASSPEYPIQPKEHGIDFLLDHRHLWIRSPRQAAILRVRDEIIKAIRDFFYERDFVLFDSPILTGAIGEAAEGGLFETEYFDLGKAYLAQTGQLYVEAAAAALGRVYCFGPTFRAEKSKTRRHLTEFWMVEPEMAWTTSDDSMQLQEELVTYVVQRTLERRAKELETLESGLARLRSVEPPFPRLSYDEAVERLRAKGSAIEWGQDLGNEDETRVTEEFDRPVFIYNYPKAAKAFYMKENPENPETVLCNDCLAPDGYGEIIGGSQREDDYDRLLARIREQKLPVKAYEWYLDLRRYGTFPHSGFGLGLERTVAWICGLAHVREAVPFPRLLNRLYP